MGAWSWKSYCVPDEEGLITEELYYIIGKGICWGSSQLGTWLIVVSNFITAFNTIKQEDSKRESKKKKKISVMHMAGGANATGSCSACTRLLLSHSGLFPAFSSDPSESDRRWTAPPAPPNQPGFTRTPLIMQKNLRPVPQFGWSPKNCYLLHCSHSDLVNTLRRAMASNIEELDSNPPACAQKKRLRVTLNTHLLAFNTKSPNYCLLQPVWTKSNDVRNTQRYTRTLIRPCLKTSAIMKIFQMWF